MNYTALLDEIREHVIASFSANNDARFTYHNLYHTQSVVNASEEMSDHYKLSEEDHFVLIAAAWFHDSMYYRGAGSHESEGAKAAAAFLKAREVREEIIKAVKKTIKATRMPQNPETLLEKIICDADLFQLGSDDFKERTKALRKEKEAVEGITFEKKQWRAQNIEFVRSHQYHTDYARHKLNALKEKHLQELIDKLGPEEKDVITSPVPPAGAEEIFTKTSKNKEKFPEKGIETMFRISSANHQRLSDMADNKAHIMITVNSIILSVIISFSLRGIERYPHLAAPSILLLLVNVVTLIFSVLATRPSIPDGTFTKEEVKNKKVNLLFFGNFYRMDLEEYSEGMFAMMSDWDFLYRSLIKDIYSQGVVLGKKYHFLRISYSVFMFGIVISVIAFVIASILYGNNP